MERFILAAAILLQNHYTKKKAMDKARNIADTWRLPDGEIDPTALITVATTMSLSEEPWWDHDDPMVRAITQLETDTLVVGTIARFVEDVEEALGRSLGEDTNAKAEALFTDRYQILAELRGEEIPDKDPLSSLLSQLMEGGAGMTDVFSMPDAEDDPGKDQCADCETCDCD